MKAQKLELTFFKKVKLTKDTYEFYFERPDKFNFRSGQYLKIFLPIENPDIRGTSRYFTISSSPLNKSHLTITTRIIRSSFKLTLNSLVSGKKIKAFGPMGYFNFNLKSEKPKLFLAGGIGITTYHSILKTLEKKKMSFNILLIVSFSKKENVIYFDELKEIESKNPKIKIIYSLTKKSFDKFESGRINKDLIIKYCPNYLDYEIFIVGSESFEENLIKLVKDMNVVEENIFTENFPGY